MEFVLDEDTIRLLTHLPGTAMVQCDLVWLDHAPVVAVAAHDPADASSTASPSTAGSRWPAPSSSSSPSTRRTSRRTATRLPRPDAGQPVQRRLLDPRHHPGRAAAARHPQPHVRRRAGRRGRQGRVQLRPARDRLPLRRRADDRRQPRGLQDRRQGDRRPARARRSRSWRSTTSARATPATSTCRCAARTASWCSGTTSTGERTAALRPLRRRRAGHAADFTLLYAPNINSYKRFADGSFAPTAIAWGLDNRTCAVRLVGHGAGARMENRVPGGDVNPYLALAAMLAGGLHGIENELPLEDELVGNAYASDKPQVPHTLASRARARSPSSERGPRGLRRRGRRPLRRTWPTSSSRPSTRPSPTGSSAADSRGCDDLAPTHLHGHQPGHRAAGHRRAPRPTWPRPTPRSSAPHEAFPAWRAVAPGRAGRAAAPRSPPSSTTTSRSSPSSRSATPGTPRQRPLGGRQRPRLPQLLLRRARAALRPADPGRRRHRRHLPRAARRRRHHRAVELPDADRRLGLRARRWPPATRSCSSRPSSPR